MAHIVTAPLVIAKKQDGSDLYLYENAELPAWVPADEVKRLSNLGLITDAGDAEGDHAKSRRKPSSESN